MKVHEDARQMFSSLLSKYGSGFEIWKNTGIVLPIGGAAKGYNETEQIDFHLIDGYDLNELWEEFNQAIRLINRDRGQLVDRLVFPVQKPIERVPQVFVEDFEDADEFGRPVGIRPAEYWDMGFPMQYKDLATRFTWRYLAEADVRQVRQTMNAVLEAYRRFLFKLCFDRIWDNTVSSATLRGGSAVTVFPFYNGTAAVDAQGNNVAPPPWKAFTHATNHTHYLSSGAATVDSADLDEMFGHIYHHGYTEGGATVILLVNEQEADVIRTFRVASGDKYDFIPDSGNEISFILNGTIIGGQPTNDTGLRGFPGFIGKYGTVSVVQEDLIPADFMFMFASGGLRAQNNPVGIREHENDSLRGLKLIPQHVHYPLIDSYAHATGGAGIRHRGAGVVMSIGAGAYAPPDELNYGGPGGR
jgi:hypothetical protein